MDIGKFGFPDAKGGKPKPSDKGLVYNRIPMRGGPVGAGGSGGSGGGSGGGNKPAGARPASALSAAGALARTLPASAKAGLPAGGLPGASGATSFYGKLAPPQLPSGKLPSSGLHFDALLEEAWDPELPALAVPELSLNPAKEVSVTLTAKWTQDKGFFNDTAVASVDAVVPEALQSLTRLEIRLYALHPDGKRELLQSKDASLTSGRAFCDLTLFIPSFRDNGEQPKACDYVFTAKHAHSKESESPKLKGEARAMAWLRLKLELAYQGPLANRKCTPQGGGRIV